MPSRNLSPISSIYWKEGPVTRMCQTEGMRNVLMLLMCAVGFAQTPPPSDSVKPDRDAVITSTVNVVIAPTTVLDRHNSYVNGLQLQDFTLYDNGKPQKINADVRDEPLSLLIAVQKSANLNDVLPKLQRIGTMLNDL